MVEEGALVVFGEFGGFGDAGFEEVGGGVEGPAGLVVDHDLAAAGIEVVPTFRRPHVTLAHVELAGLVSGLQACDHRQLENPYYQGPQS